MPVPLRAGGTYILHDYTLIQVVALADGTASCRVQARFWSWRRRSALRSWPVGVLAARVRAEINGEFFPDFSQPGPYRFRHGGNEAAGLSRFLTQRAPHRPFASRP